MKALSSDGSSQVCWEAMAACARRSINVRTISGLQGRDRVEQRGRRPRRNCPGAANAAWSQLAFNTDVRRRRRSSTPHYSSPPATMKLSWGLFFSSLYCTASAATPAVSPETARLIIAQRLGLSRFHSVEHADAEAIRHINAYGGRQQKLFGGADADASQARLLMWIEDGDEQDAAGAPPLPSYRED
jgi:hypothetical protein